MKKTNENKWCVYIHTNKINNKAYIGITENIKRRWGYNGAEYLQKDKDGNYRHPVFANALQKYSDWENDWEHIIFAEYLCEDEAKHMEKLLIVLFKTNCRRYKNPELGYNMTDGGEGASGTFCTEETKRKLSKALKGRFVGESNPFYGQKHSEETKRKMRENHYCATGENNPNYGKSASEETREKMRKAKENIQKCVVQIDKNGEFIAEYESTMSAERATGLYSSQISACCHHKNGARSYGGYQWLFKTEYDKTGSSPYKTPSIKSVVQLDSDKNLIAIYDSLKNASEAIGISMGWLSICCRDQTKNAGGYKWMYKTEYDILNTK